MFYSYSDHLVYFTTYCMLARKYSIHVLELCQMPDHVHDAVSAQRPQDLEGFKRDVNSQFARSYNNYWQISGPVFEHPYGSAVKRGAKNGRTLIVYIGNNPVERQLVTQAEEYRWNYLAYACSDHPFSEKIVIRNASIPLRKAVKEVKAQFKAGVPMNYALLKRLFCSLDQKECQQLTDLIISTYNVIDYTEASRYFNSYEEMLVSMHANTGSEYDLNEVFVGKSDVCYGEMSVSLRNSGRVGDIHEILRMTLEQKRDTFQFLRQNSYAMGEQIAKFLHLPVKIIK